MRNDDQPPLPHPPPFHEDRRGDDPRNFVGMRPSGDEEGPARLPPLQDIDARIPRRPRQGRQIIGQMSDGRHARPGPDDVLRRLAGEDHWNRHRQQEEEPGERGE